MQSKYSNLIHSSTPDNINKKSHYLFFMHGKIVEKKGLPASSRRYGDYEYQNILDTFASNGFNVISEARSHRTDIYDYATDVAEKVEQLLNSGVPASHITVSGFSKGGRMTLVVSSLLNNKDLNYVVLAGCRTSDIEKFILNPSGRVLSIFDSNDDSFESCSEIFSEGKDNLYSREIILNTGDGHGAFYSAMPEWVTPMIEWAKN
jgi:predicted esterase